MLGELIGGFVVLLIGVTLIPTVAELAIKAQCEDGSIHNSTDTWGTCNVTGTSSVIVGMITLFFALAIMATAIGLAAQGLRSAGMLGA